MGNSFKIIKGKMNISTYVKIYLNEFHVFTKQKDLDERNEGKS